MYPGLEAVCHNDQIISGILVFRDTGQLLSVTNRHQLDKTDIKSMVSGQLCQSKAFSLIDTSLENDIDLGWNLLLLHGMKPVQYLWKLVISGDLSIDIRVKSIQADIDSVKSLAAEAFCIVGKKDTIGRRRYLIECLESD